MYDIVIIGAGVTGCSVARELSRYNARVCVVEKEDDVCCGTSKANSAIIHAGFDAAAGSLMAKLNILGNRMMGNLAEDLDIPFKRNGSLVVCLFDEDRPQLQKLYENGLANGVEQLRIVEKEELQSLEPNISPNAVAALYAPTAGIICPFTLTFALAENAYTNGVDFKLNTEVTGLHSTKDCWVLETPNGTIETKYVINAAGVYSDVFHNMVSAKKIHITPRRGDYFLLDKNTGNFAVQTIFPQPSKLGKGVLVSPTIHGNTIVGPTAIDVEDREGTNTTAAGLNDVLSKAGSTVKDLPIRQVITSFAGLRAHEDHHEFVLGEVEDAPGFIDCAGIESPGLTSSPAIGKMIGDLLKEKMSLELNPHFNGTRKGVLNPQELSKEERTRLIKEHPEYGNIICRCEGISEGELLDAIHRPLGATSLDGLKRRTRQGTGRCQAGFCTPRAMEILVRELHIEQSELTKCGGKSKLIVGKTKEWI